jgi:hypothetical protein
MNAIAARVQYFQRGIEILAFEVTIEGVGEQNDFVRFAVRISLSLMRGLDPRIQTIAYGRLCA